MSASQAAARIYADALFGVAVDAGSPEQVGAELRVVRDALAGLAPDVRTFFEMPQLRREDKWEIVTTAFGDKLGRPVLGLLHVLVDKRREVLLDGIVTTYDELLDTREGRVQANVVSARPLEPELVDALRAAIENQTQQHVVLHQRVDPTMIGGIRVSLGDLVVDGTLRRGLLDMRRSLASSLT